MTRRRLFLLITTACLLAVPLAVRWAMTPAPGVTEENFRRLHRGMTLDEMVAIMGEPSQRFADHWWAGHLYRWTAETGEAHFLMNGEHATMGEFVRGRNMGESPGPVWLAERPESLITRIRRWLGM